MSSGWLILGTIGQLLLAYFLFMVVVFSGAGIANGNNLGKLQLMLLNLSMYVLPAVCVLSAGMVTCTSMAAASCHIGGMRCRLPWRRCTSSTRSA